MTQCSHPTGARRHPSNVLSLPFFVCGIEHARYIYCISCILYSLETLNVHHLEQEKSKTHFVPVLGPNLQSSAQPRGTPIPVPMGPGFLWVQVRVMAKIPTGYPCQCLYIRHVLEKHSP